MKIRNQYKDIANLIREILPNVTGHDETRDNFVPLYSMLVKTIYQLKYLKDYLDTEDI